MHEEVRPAHYTKFLMAYVVALHFDLNLIQREDYIFLEIIAFLHTDDFHVSQRNKIVYVMFSFRRVNCLSASKTSSTKNPENSYFLHSFFFFSFFLNLNIWRLEQDSPFDNSSAKHSLRESI